MAEKNEETMDSLRNELNAMRDQVESLVKSLADGGSEVSSDMISKLEKELEHYRKIAADKVHKVYEAGSAGIEQVGEQVRRNPMASLLVAFGAGCALSWLFRQSR